MVKMCGEYRKLSRQQCSGVGLMASITLLCFLSFSHCLYADYETINAIGRHWSSLGWHVAELWNCTEVGFRGLTCSSDLTHVVALELYSSQLTGSIPPEIANLTGLSILYLYDNQLTGSIPPELGNLSVLSELHLEQNQLTGSVPPELDNLQSLQALYLDTNQLNGTVPPQLSNMASLRYLYLSLNQFTGSIPPELGKMPSLSELSLDHNQLTGTIPIELNNLRRLAGLHLQGNHGLDICSTNIIRTFSAGNCELDAPLLSRIQCKAHWISLGCTLIAR